MSLEMADGFRVALRAAEAASRVTQTDLDVAAGTFVFWCAAVDNQMTERHGKEYTKLRDHDPAGKIFPGVVLARNAIAHGLRTVVTPAGQGWPMTWPDTWPVSLWRPLDELISVWPEKFVPTKHQRDSYLRWMSGRPVTVVVVAALQWLVDLDAQSSEVDRGDMKADG